MPPNRQIKRYSRNFLRGHWGQVIVAFCVFIAILLIITLFEDILRLFLNVPSLLFSENDSVTSINTDWISILITLGGTLLKLFFIAPISLGIAKWNWQLTNMQKPKTSVIFHYYSSFKLFVRSLAYQLSFWVRVWFWGILLSLPSAVAYLATQQQIKELLHYELTVNMSYVLEFSSVLLLLTSIVLTMVIMLRYCLAAYLVVDDDQMRVRHAFKKSSKYSKGFRSQYFILIFSFIGWIFLCLLALPAFYTFPYIWSTQACFAHCCIYNYESMQKTEKPPVKQEDANHTDSSHTHGYNI